MTEDEKKGDSGPVPVRDLMKQMVSRPEAEGEPRWEGDELTFERDGDTWAARPAGAGAYGTGSRGRARLVAVHFFHGQDPDTPVREALVPAGVFPHLRPEELRALCDRATPIELDRDD
ncbi:MAG: hypothetical protein R3314_03815 [Longimicrobiales bacterium]|nr:hypothetical protein [Longimicrobiales bacterium]